MDIEKRRTGVGRRGVGVGIGWCGVGGMDFGWRIGLVVVGIELVGKNIGGLENVLFCQSNVL